MGNVIFPNQMESSPDTNYSYWELQQYFKKFDLLVIGSGIVGLSTAISYKQKNKLAQVLILERGFLPDGASSKNAGFACFGSPGELLKDLETIDPDLVWETLQMRFEGLKLLRARVKDKNMEYHRYGGYELFRDKENFEISLSSLEMLNKKIKELSGEGDCFAIVKKGKFRFRNLNGIISNRLEGQINTGMMLASLIKIAHNLGIQILNNVEIRNTTESAGTVYTESNRGTFKASKLVIATNGFAAQLTGIKEVQPARAQVLITSPVKGLKVRGTFHFEEGYYYFRNIHERILLGGGRNLDLDGETTFTHGLSDIIQEKLDYYLREMILPKNEYTIEHRWSGIMGVGPEKKPIVKKTSENTVVAVRMGGMGIAIGSKVGELAAEILQD